MSTRARALTALVAIVAYLATPALVLCHEADGSFRLELRLNSCCDSRDVAGGVGAADMACSPTEPECACLEDVALVTSAARQKPRQECAHVAKPAPASDSTAPRFEPAAHSQNHLPDPGTRAAASGAPLACLKTIILLV